MAKSSRKTKSSTNQSQEPEVKNAIKVEPKEEPTNCVDDTIFIRNLSFDTEEEDLKKFIETNFGQTVYCLICKDKQTDESKGTAFAKFENPEDAVKCLKEFKDRDLQVKFHLDGRNLIVLPALSKDKVTELTSLTKEKKDKRNLALAKVGSFKSDSIEVQEMSKGDAEKRRSLDLRKREKLKNLHNLVSDVRLCVHNLPSSIDDQDLRRIFKKAIEDDAPDAKIIECRVMKNKKGGGQLGTSKGFGFVAFSKHEHAILALEKLNNNPTVFSRDKRPIVEFSIENLVALNKKKTRLANSQRKLEHAKQQIAQKTKSTPQKRISAKALKKKSTVTIKNFDENEKHNHLKKVNKLKKKR